LPDLSSKKKISYFNPIFATPVPCYNHPFSRKVPRRLSGEKGAGKRLRRCRIADFISNAECILSSYF
jgi:hypothetical protein